MKNAHTQIMSTVVSFPGSTRRVTMPSQSRPDVNHTVLLACSCEGFQFSGHCYHLADASLILREDARAASSRTKVRIQSCIRRHR